LLAKRRCLILADGFYEWGQFDGRKQPVYLHMQDHSPFVFAGLWDSGMQEGGKSQSYGTIITTSANKLISPVHDRMPVILPQSAIDAWLDPNYKDVSRLLQCIQMRPWRGILCQMQSTHRRMTAPS
jgi:putative SOS response-associated peptidase YedK